MAKLGDICEIVSGTTPKSNVPEYWDGKINWVTPAELNDDTMIIHETQRKITEQAIKDSSLKSFPAGTVLLSSRAPIGKTAIAGVEMYCNQGFKNLICSDKIYNKYLFWFLRGKTEYLNGLGRGSTFKEISKEIVGNIEIPLPPVSQQKRYAENLDKISRLISLRKQQLAKLDELVKARFVEMFGDPEINPYGFEKHRLNDYCDLQNGYAFKSEDYVDKSEVLNCRMSNIRPDGSFSASYHPKYLPAEYWSKFSSYRLFDGDVIIAMTDMANDPKILGVPTIVSCAGKKMLLNQRVGKLLFRDTAEINRIYLMKALSHESVRAKLAKHSGGGLQINVGKPAILSSIILYPPMKFQNKFSEFSIDIDKRKLTIQKSLGTIEVLKKMLMQEYFG